MKLTTCPHCGARLTPPPVPKPPGYMEAFRSEIVELHDRGYSPKQIAQELAPRVVTATEYDGGQHSTQEGRIGCIASAANKVLRKAGKDTAPNVKASARNKAIVAMRVEGHTLQRIGERFGLGRERVRAILCREERRLEEEALWQSAEHVSDDSPIEQLGLKTARVRALMGYEQIRTVGDLVKRTEAELLGFYNFGAASLHEIKRALAAHGRRLGEIVADAEALRGDQT
jgi:hypothetical protein